MNLDPINFARFNGSWDARCTPAAATNYLLEKIETSRLSPTRLRCEDLKQVTTSPICSTPSRSRRCNAGRKAIDSFMVVGVARHF